VIAAEHPDKVRTALPADPASFCVIQSRYSRAEVTRARAPWEAEMSGRLDSSAGVVDGIGQGVGQDGQVTLDTTVVMVTDMVRTWLAAAPAGLVVVHPWLRQVSANAPLPPAAPSGQPDASAIVTEAAASTR
jgi:hypothetical protein